MFAVVYSLNSILLFIKNLLAIKNNLKTSENLSIVSNVTSFKLVFKLNKLFSKNIQINSVLFNIIKNNFYLSNSTFFIIINLFHDKKNLITKKMLNNLNFNLSNNCKIKFFSFSLNDSTSKFSNVENLLIFSNSLINQIPNFISKLVKINTVQIKDLKNYKIKFSVSDFFKNLNNTTLNYINVLFLRKNKIFNKGRYSRNRQYYRTGVYWCLYINIIAVIGIYFWFYRFNMNFGYLWWLLFFFIASFFFSRTLSNNLINPKNLFLQIFNSTLWFFNILNSFIMCLFSYLKNFINYYQ